MTAATGKLPPLADSQRGALVPRIPPPLYYGAGFAVGMLLNAAMPLSMGARPVSAVGGGVVVLAGVALALSGVVSVVRHRTTIVPHHPVTALITTGAYRISRNPMYTGLAIAYLGGALIVGSWWPLIVAPVFLVAMQQIVIRPEERYLADHFGTTYLDYRTRVRRWL